MRIKSRTMFLRLLVIAVLAAFLSPVLLASRESVSAASSLTLTLTKTNSWAESKKTRSQFSAEIKNEGTSAVSGWVITITVPEDSSMSASDGWNGIFSLSGTVLTITPKEYNKQIAADGKTSDIGFILTTPKAVELTGSVTATAASADISTGTTANISTGTTTNTSSPGSTADTDASGTSIPDVSGASTQDDWLHTDGSKILDKNGTEVWLTGINWFGYNTGTNIFDGVWSCNMQEAIASIADRGFNILRIPISSELVLAWKNGVYPAANFNQASNPELVGLNSLEIFDLAIAACKANGIKVMLDIHSAETDSMGHMVNLWYTDTISTQDYYDSLSFLAKRFADDDTVVAYDLKNEPHGKPGEAGAIWNDSTSANNWKYVAQTAGNLVLDANPYALIMIEGIEIYPKDTAVNGDFSSADSADYYFTWWGANLRGVREYPVDFGSQERNAQIVYSPHDYGPAVYAQPWFADGFTYDSLQADCWNDNWLYISKENIAPILIGEWGGFLTESNLTWMTYLRTLIKDNHLNHTFWCFNANSGDTGGLVRDDFTTWDEEKYSFVKEVLWQEDGKFVGLDHVISLGKSGSGISLSVISGAVDTSAGADESAQETTGESSAAALESSPTASAEVSAEVSASQGKAADSDDNKSGWSMLDTSLAGLLMIFVLAGTAAIGYVTYTANKRKGEDKK